VGEYEGFVLVKGAGVERGGGDEVEIKEGEGGISIESGGAGK